MSDDEGSSTRPDDNAGHEEAAAASAVVDTATGETAGGGDGEEGGGGPPASSKGATAQLLHGTDIGTVLESDGPVVTCVVLRHVRRDGKDGKPHPASPKADELHKRVVLVEDIEEVELDTTPRNGAVKKLLGGPFTFLGQYPTEGVVVVARRDFPDDLSDLTVHSLRELCREWDINTSDMLEKSELVDALVSTQLPWNPHRLQPPLEGIRVRGDILLLRVAETDEALDNDDEEDGGDGEGKKQLEVLSNEEFFLNYTKAEYVAFASRTDVVAEPPPDENEEEASDNDEEEDDEEEDDDDEDYILEDDEMEEKQAVLNLVMGEILRKFREENGRGPDTRELLELRSQVAAQLDVEVATVEALEESTRTKRKSSDDDDSESKFSKKVKFVKIDGHDNNDDEETDDASAKGSQEKLPS